MQPAATSHSATRATAILTRSPLALWHLLSLDAPTVAFVWLLFLARASHISLPAALPAAMFLAVWLIYATDRLLDARILAARPSAHLEPTQHFYRRNRLPFAFALCTASAALAVLVPTLPVQQLRPDLLLGAALVLWFSLIHFTRLRLPKTFAPGPFFACALFIPVSLHHSVAATLIPALLFASLCTLNCLYIQCWQRPPAKWLRLFALALIVPALLFPSPITLAIALASALLLLLSYLRLRLNPITLRAAADLALLTPLLIFPFIT